MAHMRVKDFRCFFQETTQKSPARFCDQEGCKEEGLYRAPTNQNLCTYYLFCLAHVRQYNARWNYYRGMTGEQFEKSRREDLTWNRPTWPLGKESSFKRDWDLKSSLSFKLSSSSRPFFLSPDIQQALKVFDLKMPLTAAILKQRYNYLVKKYHPDAQPFNKKGEEKLKVINRAYTELKKFLRSDSGI